MRTLNRIGAAAAVAAVAITAVPAASAHETGGEHSHEKPSWEQFKSETFRDADGQYIVDGDIPVRNSSELFDFYKNLSPKDSKAENNKDNGTGDLIAHEDMNGNPALWSESEARNLTYCVSDDFGPRKDEVVQAMEGGAGMWEQASSGIDFQYDSSQDSDCNTQNDNVVFSVEPTTSTGYIARAFFPDTPKSERNVLVADQFYSSGWQQDAIMGHELGHTLGFRHEHTRPEAGTCFEDNNWRPLTPYDSESIMHYPQCNGSSSTLSFSELDQEGVQKAYGA